MASCEKCWVDAFNRERRNPSKCQGEHYFDLIEERKSKTCTPEQQAGEDAGVCVKCKRNTMHQIINTCMNPKCN